jgi:hypothetical protein
MVKRLVKNKASSNTGIKDKVKLFHSVKIMILVNLCALTWALTRDRGNCTPAAGSTPSVFRRDLLPGSMVFCDFNQTLPRQCHLSCSRA